ncbi:MAG: N-(5'-phosphoribosyl)anthranilate isomerase [Albidovulum sp.]|uniref:N-(5'-phosphoribosyl)anthranilate isomerase n=1 Tax=Albidovulum sp. TaxID=1872424 RepID=UPI003CB11212
MAHSGTRSHADLWIETLFSAKAVGRGGIVRRNVTWVENEIGRDRFIAEVRRRGFHLVECGPQFIVICHKQGLRVIC